MLPTRTTAAPHLARGVGSYLVVGAVTPNGLTSNIHNVSFFGGGVAVHQSSEARVRTRLPDCHIGTMVVDEVGERVVAQPIKLDVKGAGIGAMIAYGILRAQVMDWTSLPEDWDGDHGHAPSRGVAGNACEVLSSLESQGIPVPDPIVSGDGEVGFRWETERGFASINLLEDGHVVAYANSGTGSPIRIDEPYSELVEFAGLFSRIASIAS
jgi:hypothetical protein